MKHVLLLPLLVLSLAACKNEVVEIPDPAPLTEENVSFFCQMNVLEHAGPKAQIHLEGYPAPLFFAQVRDAVAYLKSPERDARILVTYVSDMGTAPSWSTPGYMNWTASDTAHFVVDAPVKGGMGAPEIVPFALLEDAEAFAQRYGGRILPITEIPEGAVIGPVDPDMDLETPS